MLTEYLLKMYSVEFWCNLGGGCGQKVLRVGREVEEEEEEEEKEEEVESSPASRLPMTADRSAPSVSTVDCCCCYDSCCCLCLYFLHISWGRGGGKCGRGPLKNKRAWDWYQNQVHQDQNHMSQLWWCLQTNKLVRWTEESESVVEGVNESESQKLAKFFFFSSYQFIQWVWLWENK